MIGAVWRSGDDPPERGDAALTAAVDALDATVVVVDDGGVPAVARGGEIAWGATDGRPVIAIAPPNPPQCLGSAAFRTRHGVRLAYVAGGMAGGIASTALVAAMRDAGLLAFFGAAGLPLGDVEQAIDELGPGDAGFNLVHDPQDPDAEAALVDLYLRRGVDRLEASAFMDLTLPVVRYRARGVCAGPDGAPQITHRVVAKVSRVEVARRFLSPPPEHLLRALVASGELTEARAALAAQVPMADDVTAEADSGGHTDNRPLLTVLPTMMRLRDDLGAKHGYPERVGIGAAGGIGTPLAAAAALSMGADYVLTGSINQACVESGTSDLVRQMLARAGQADFAMAPAADMFELGVEVQVLKRGTLFPLRAAKLDEAYRAAADLDGIPPRLRQTLERDLFRAPLAKVWDEVRAYFTARAPEQIALAERDPKHKLALICRWYLGRSTRWAIEGRADRRVDFQIWCGPAMGAFNAWVAGSHLDPLGARRIADIADALMRGAARQLRVDTLRRQGVRLPPAALDSAPHRR